MNLVLILPEQPPRYGMHRYPNSSASLESLEATAELVAWSVGQTSTV